MFYCLGTLLPCLYDQGAVKAFHFAVAYVGPQARIIPDEDCLSMIRRGFTLPFMLDKESGFVANDVARPAQVPVLVLWVFLLLASAPPPIGIRGGVTSEKDSLLAAASRGRECSWRR